MLLQSKEADCGKSVIRNLLSYFNRDKGYYTCNLSSDCKSFYEMRNKRINNSVAGLFRKGRKRQSGPKSQE